MTGVDTTCLIFYQKVKTTGFSRSALAIAVMVHSVGGVSRLMIRKQGDKKASPFWLGLCGDYREVVGWMPSKLSNQVVGSSPL